MKGKSPCVYNYYENNSFIMTGTVEEISGHLNIARQSLWMRIDRSNKAIREGRKPRNIYELELERESVNEYVLFMDGNFVGRGTVKELCKLTGYTRNYLDQHINGYYKAHGYKKKHPIEIFKKVG